MDGGAYRAREEIVAWDDSFTKNYDADSVPRIYIHLANPLSSINAKNLSHSHRSALIGSCELISLVDIQY